MPLLVQAVARRNSALAGGGPATQRSVTGPPSPARVENYGEPARSELR